MGLFGSTTTNEIQRHHLKYLRSKKSVRVGFRTIEIVEDNLGIFVFKYHYIECLMIL